MSFNELLKKECDFKNFMCNWMIAIGQHYFITYPPTRST